MSNERFKQQCRDLAAKLRRLAKAAPAIARASVGAGLSTLARSASRAAIGGIKEEVGWYIRNSGSKTWGRAGLMQYPERRHSRAGGNPGPLSRHSRAGGNPVPHGLFIDSGTKYIAARHVIGEALKRAMPAAMRAMQRTVQSRINRVLSQ